MFENYEIIGNPQKNVLIKGKGIIKVQWGNKFIDLIKDGQINTGGLSVNTVDSVNNIGKVNGFYYVKSDSSVYLVINDEIVPIVDGDNSSYVSYLEQNNIDEDKRLQALKNIGFVFSTKAELSSLNFSNSIVYCQEDNQLYIIDNGKVTKFNSTITEVVHASQADKADKLTNSRKIWGQNFDGTSDITGNQQIQGNSTVTGDQKVYGSQSVNKGIIIGNYQAGFLGSGASIDSKGNMEVESLYARTSISAPEFTFNRISVSYGETWCTNGYGTIQDVDTTNKIVYLKLEDGDFVSVEAGDLCRGIFSDGASTYTDTKDSCGFELKDLLFTSYFKVLAVSSKSFTYELKEGSKDPCPYMKFAQYGNVSTKSTRCSSIYTNTLNHPYTICLDLVGQYFSDYNYTAKTDHTDEENKAAFDPFTIYPYNLVKIEGYLEGRQVKLAGSDTTKTLKGYGLYVQNNVYLGGAVVQFNAETLQSLQNSLGNVLVYDRVVSVDTNSEYKCLTDFTKTIPLSFKVNGVECTDVSIQLSSQIASTFGNNITINISKDAVVNQEAIAFTVQGTYQEIVFSVSDYLTIIPNRTGMISHIKYMQFTNLLKDILKREDSINNYIPIKGNLETLNLNTTAQGQWVNIEMDAYATNTLRIQFSSTNYIDITPKGEHILKTIQLNNDGSNISISFYKLNQGLTDNSNAWYKNLHIRLLDGVLSDSGNMKGEYQDTNTESSSNIEDYTWMSLIGDQIGLYDLGVYSNTTTYTNDGEWAPMIKYNDDFFYLNYIGSIVGQTPSLSSVYWKQMSRVDAIYASILMADYATINKAVFKSGYMFSQHGVSNGVPSTNYQTFDPDSLSTFNPNFYIDFLTGKVKCSNIEVTGGTFSIGDNFSVDYSGNLVAQNATLSGDITANKVLAATGSFSSLTCVNSSGSSNIGTLQFGNNGALWWSGDLYMNGSRTIGSNTRSLRFFAQDLWCRGSFGSMARNLVKIVGNTAYYYSFGTDSTEHLNVYTTVNLESKITSTGETYYNIPCYGNPYFQDASGMPIDTVVFATPNTDTTTYNYNIQLSCSQRVTLFNACDDKSANIYIRGNNFEIKGGYVIILQNFKTFLINETTGTLGEGHVLFINTDNNWPH